ncbi:MAG: CoA-binding protein [Acidobacteriia bacterium]|nr:CoA-binding protein [Terriglobia bacterium]
MTSKAAVADFVSQRKLAVVGVSRKKMKFGNLAFRELKRKGYKLFPVHPHAEQLEGERCSASLAALPEPVDGLLVIVPPAQAEQVVREAAAAGIRRVWLQQGAGSAAAIRFCAENGISLVHGECILMFAEPAAFYHRAHRWVWKLLGKLPR